MAKKKLGLIFLVMGLIWGCKEKPPTGKVLPLKLGTTTVDLVIYGTQPRPWVLFNMHDDENTAVEAGLAVLDSVGGLLATLKHNGKRLIEFQLNDSTFVIDPNRIYTDAGIRATLDKYSQYSPTAHQEVQKFARAVLTALHLDSLAWVITLHNNGEGEYSVNSYLPGGEYATDAHAAYRNPKMDGDDFYFVTDSSLFEVLKSRQWNVVLQDNAAVTDDGSLSVYCGRLGIPYVNVEAQHGHLQTQKRMIKNVIQIIRERTSAEK